MGGRAVDQDFGGTGAGVVVRGLAHAVGSGVEEDDEVAGFDGGEGAVAGEEVAGLADGADDVDLQLGVAGFGGLADGEDLVVGVVERRADQVVHGGVGDDEGLFAVLFDEEDAGEQSASLSDDEAAGFEEEMGWLAGEAFGEGCGVLFYLLRRIEGGGAVVDAEAAAGVDIADVVAVFAQFGDEGGDAGEGGGEGGDLADLRADVDADAGRVEPLRLCGFAIDRSCGFDVDAELVFAEAGGDVGMGFGEDVGVDAEGEAGAEVEQLGAGGEEVEFGLGLDVEEEDVGAEGVVDLPDLLADAGEDHLFQGGLAGFADALQFAAGDDVEACSLLCQEAEDGER